MDRMDIHQMQVKYEPTADRLLWQVRTRGGEIYAVWLTRRMVSRLWPPFQQLVTRGAVAQVARPDAVVLPEAREMLAQAARERPLPTADFKTRFDPTPVAQPLGPEPLLPTAIDLAPGVNGKGLAIKLREANGRSVELKLGDDLATALLRLVEKAVAASDWGLQAGVAPAAAEPQASVPPSSLN
jgi:hypothetical protein